MTPIANLDSKGMVGRIYVGEKKVREKSRECHNHKLQPFPDTKRKRKQTRVIVLMACTLSDDAFFFL